MYNIIFFKAHINGRIKIQINIWNLETEINGKSRERHPTAIHKWATNIEFELWLTQMAEDKYASVTEAKWTTVPKGLRIDDNL